MSQYRIKERKNVAKVEQKIKKKKVSKERKKGKKHSFYLYNQKLQTETLRLTLNYLFSYRFLNKGCYTIDHVIHRNTPIL